MVLSPLTDRHESGRPLRQLALPASRLTRHRMTARVRPARAAGCSLHGPSVTVPGGQAPKASRSPHAAGAGSVSDSHQTGDRCESWGKEMEHSHDVAGRGWLRTCPSAAQRWVWLQGSGGHPRWGLDRVGLSGGSGILTSREQGQPHSQVLGPYARAAAQPMGPR